MLISINDTLELGEPLELTLDGDEIIGLAVQGRSEAHGEVVPDTLDFSFSSPVKVHLVLSSTGRDVLINGSVKAGLTLECSRCLKDYPFALDSGFSCFAPLAEEAEGKQGKKATKKSQVKPDEDAVIERELSHIEDGELNLSALILEEIALSLPTKPLCKKTCKGLCLSCGTDLNTTSCKCADNIQIDPRLKKLMDFKSG